MPFVTFSSDDLSGTLDDSARFRAWRDRYMEHHGHLDFRRPHDRPFSVRFTLAQYGFLGVGQFSGTVTDVARTPHHVMTKPSDTFCLVLNRARTLFACSHRGRECDLVAGGVTLFHDTAPSKGRGAPENSLLFVQIPRPSLVQLVDNPEDLTGSLFDPSNPVTRHLKQYLALVSHLDETDEDGRLGGFVERTLLELVALSLGATKDTEQLTPRRGLRSARVQLVLARMAAGFFDPGFSLRVVANELGLSERYIQDLLQETGTPFTARLLELRLQHARKMLSDARHDLLKISEIATACGFNEVPYFNRCFRRRFGMSPSDYRWRG
jgi:AraC-like DNA-binding protein